MLCYVVMLCYTNNTIKTVNITNSLRFCILAALGRFGVIQMGRYRVTQMGRYRVNKQADKQHCNKQHCQTYQPNKAN